MSWLPKEIVVVPIDFSEHSFKALEAALELVADASHLHAIHVLPELSIVEPGIVWEKVGDENRRRHAEEAIRERTQDPRYAGLKAAIRFGDAGSAIAQYADDVHADLIVMPSHGRTGLTRLLIGSVAERAVRLAHCPILILRKPRSH